MTRAIQLCTLLLALLAVPSHAHDALPIALSLDQTGEREYSLRARFPPTFADDETPQSGVAAPCEIHRQRATTQVIQCPDASTPPALTLTYPGPAGNAPILLRLSYVDGQRQTLVSPAGTSRIALPDRQTRSGVFSGYFRSGLSHIFGGADHLLFLVCLMLIAQRPVRIAWTVTGFTLGHALTISLAALGLAMVDAGAVEVLIALSIVFAAAEIARGRKDSLTWRKPSLVAALFGLLHGLGFAGALNEIGLPQGEVPVALLAFNLGIETGQLAFVAALMLLAGAAHWLALHFWPSPERIPAPALAAWPIGIIASLWFFARLHAL
ncbi:MAG: HupE/UreJ family protein [Novosphingobium sp.]|nr:HupE/UreJ family protein [Novosphingobium sp.]